MDTVNQGAVEVHPTMEGGAIDCIQRPSSCGPQGPYATNCSYCLWTVLVKLTVKPVTGKACKSQPAELISTEVAAGIYRNRISRRAHAWCTLQCLSDVKNTMIDLHCRGSSLLVKLELSYQRSEESAENGNFTLLSTWSVSSTVKHKNNIQHCIQHAYLEQHRPDCKSKWRSYKLFCQKRQLPSTRFAWIWNQDTRINRCISHASEHQSQAFKFRQYLVEKPRNQTLRPMGRRVSHQRPPQIPFREEVHYQTLCLPDKLFYYKLEITGTDMRCTEHLFYRWILKFSAHSTQSQFSVSLFTFKSGCNGKDISKGAVSWNIL